MGMICILVGVTHAQINLLHRSPELANTLAQAAAEADGLPSAAFGGALEPTLDLDKSWHILHYLMTGHVDAAPAPGDDLLTGEPVGGDDGYGAPRLHTATEVKAFAEFLRAQDVGRIQARVNYHTMMQAQVYGMPSGGRSTDAELEAEVREIVADDFPRLRDYVAHLAARHDGMLVYLS